MPHLKMLYLHHRKDLDLNDWIKKTNLPPVSISYEYDPLDVIKAKKIKPDTKKRTDLFIKNRRKFLTQRDQIKSKNSPIQPNGLFKELRNVIPKNSVIT